MPEKATSNSDSRAEVRISGRVQGVFFRSNTCETARSLGLRGYVRNLPDGRVKAVFEGPEEKIREALSFCKKGSRMAQVESVEVEWGEATGEFSGFSVRR